MNTDSSSHLLAHVTRAQLVNSDVQTIAYATAKEAYLAGEHERAFLIARRTATYDRFISWLSKKSVPRDTKRHSRIQVTDRRQLTLAL